MICNSEFIEYNSNVDSSTERKGASLSTLPHIYTKAEHEKAVFMIKKVCPICGQEFMSTRSIVSNRDKYCSKECSIKARIKDLTGRKFGKLTVVEFKGSNNKTGALWLCKCECGNEKIITSRNLLSGVTKSCGCLSKEKPNHTTHGLCYTRLHGVWASMKSRCYNPNNKRYKNYGGRGIKVCDEWQEFRPFYNWAIANGYDENAPRGQYTIDRIDVNGDYEPHNCRWITIEEQQKNKQHKELPVKEVENVD